MPSLPPASPLLPPALPRDKQKIVIHTTTNIESSGVFQSISLNDKEIKPGSKVIYSGAVLLLGEKYSHVGATTFLEVKIKSGKSIMVSADKLEIAARKAQVAEKFPREKDRFKKADLPITLNYPASRELHIKPSGEVQIVKLPVFGSLDLKEIEPGDAVVFNRKHAGILGSKVRFEGTGVQSPWIEVKFDGKIFQVELRHLSAASSNPLFASMPSVK